MPEKNLSQSVHYSKMYSHLKSTIFTSYKSRSFFERFPFIDGAVGNIFKIALITSIGYNFWPKTYC